MRDYYEVLGVDRGATDKEIKDAYRLLVKKHHPDVNDGASSEEFIEIQRAWEVLSSSEERAFYDEHGFSKTDDDMSNLQNLASELVFRCMNADIQPDHLINEIEKEVNDVIEKLKSQKKDCENDLNKMLRQKEALKVKDGLKYDIMSIAIDNLIRQAEAEKFTIEQQVSIREKLLVFIENYEKAEDKVKTDFGFAQYVRPSFGFPSP